MQNNKKNLFSKRCLFIFQVWRSGNLPALAFSLFLLPLSGGSLDASPPPAPPDWGPWSAWSACSRTCEAGVQRRERVCLNVTGGCEGGALGWRACSLHPCPADAPSWRQEQCSRYLQFFSSVSRVISADPDYRISVFAGSGPESDGFLLVGDQF